MSSTTQPWTWTSRQPPGPQVATAGQRWTFHLPLSGRGAPPRIEWSDLPWGADSHQSASDPLTLVVDIPSDLSGVFVLRYRIGDQALLGELKLKILPPSADAAALPLPPIPPVQPAPGHGLPTPAEVLDRARSLPPLVPFSSVEPDTGCSPDLQAASPLTGDYEIRVYREGTPLPQLTRPLLRHKSLLVGKVSASQATIPDIDLRHQFADLRSEAQCSRQQAKIYWSADRIVLQNKGKSSLTLPGGRPLPPIATHDWQPGEEVVVPGGLILRLERSRS